MSEPALQSSPLPDSPSPYRLSSRGVAAGLAMVVLGGLIGMYSNYSSRSSGFAYSNIPLAAFLPFTLFVLGINPLLKRFRPTWSLSPAELMLAFSMAWVGSMFAARALLGSILIGIAAPYYIATPENDLAGTIHPHLPDWAFPNDLEAMRGFFEGLPEGSAVPWQPWVIPVAWWSTFLLALVLVMFGVSMLLRRQWEERERLTFALAEQPLTMIRGTESERMLPDFAYDRLFWIGFAIPTVIILWNMLTFFFHLLPKIPITQIGSGWGNQIVLPWKGFPRFCYRINFYVTGFAYLANTDVLISIVIFYFLSCIQSAVFTRIGYALPSSMASYGVHGVPSIWQNQGAIFFIVIWGCWVARDHFRDVWRRAIDGEAPEERVEMLSYRAVLLMVGIGSAYLIFWLAATGMAVWLAAFFALMYLIVMMGMTKIVAETGLPYVSWSVSPHAMIVDSIGTQGMSPQQTAAFGYSLAYYSDKKPTMLCSPMHSTVLVDRFKQDGSKILAAMMLAAATAIVLGVWFTLKLGYAHGAHNFGGYEYQYVTRHLWRVPSEMIKDPPGADLRKFFFFGLGSVVMALLTMMRYRFAWWRLHPVGFAISGIQPVYFHTFNIFLIWLVKSLVLSIGGTQLYQRSKLVFLGILVGYTISVGIAFTIDFIWFPGQGHLLHTW